MRCSWCKGKTKPIDTVHNPLENETYRKHKCLDCGHIFYTVEYELIPNKRFRKDWTRFYRQHTDNLKGEKK